MEKYTLCQSQGQKGAFRHSEILAIWNCICVLCICVYASSTFSLDGKIALHVGCKTKIKIVHPEMNIYTKHWSMFAFIYYIWRNTWSRSMQELIRFNIRWHLCHHIGCVEQYFNLILGRTKVLISKWICCFRKCTDEFYWFISCYLFPWKFWVAFTKYEQK